MADGEWEGAGYREGGKAGTPLEKARRDGKTEMVALFERYKEKREQTVAELRAEPGMAGKPFFFFSK